MRELIKSLCESLPMVKLYLDDLEEILADLSKVSDNVVVTTGKYELDDLGELSKLRKEELEEIRFVARDPYVSLEILPDSGFLYIAEDKGDSRATYERLKQIVLRGKRRSLPYRFLLVFPAIGGGIIGMSIIELIKHIVTSDIREITQSLILLALGCVVMVIAVVKTPIPRSIIILKHRMDAPSFLKRNRDKILLILISALLSVLATLLIQKLF